MKKLLALLVAFVSGGLTIITSTSFVGMAEAIKMAPLN